MDNFKDNFMRFAMADDEYVDEEYQDEDEGYEDDGEGYDEYDGYAEEDYGDENYNYPSAECYDTKIERVLNEIAEIRRSVGSPNIIPAFSGSPAPAQPFVYAPQPAQHNNEPAIYNELSRLREELGKTQASQEMHVELSRLKEQLTRDAQMNEVKLLDEIKRLNQRIEELKRR